MEGVGKMLALEWEQVRGEDAYLGISAISSPSPVQPVPNWRRGRWYRMPALRSLAHSSVRYSQMRGEIFFRAGYFLT